MKWLSPPLFLALICATMQVKATEPFSANSGHRDVSQQYVAKEIPLSSGAQSVASKKFDPFVADHAMAGAVIVIATKDKVLSEGSVGYSNIGRNAPMKLDSLFWIASMSKPITATALMMLVDEGKVRLDDSVSKFIPEFASILVGDGPAAKRPDHPILVRDFLSHSSGLPFSVPSETPTLDLLSLAQRAQDYAKTRLQSAPGEKYSYSNAGINTAARIIEIVGGMPYEQFLKKRIFDPLGMSDTTFFPTKPQLERLATSYKATPDHSGLLESIITQLSYPLDDPKRTAMPAGGLFSTAGDVTKFCQMIANHGVANGERLVSEKSITEMTTVHTAPITEGVSYGYGWDVGQGMYFHGGAYRTSMNIYADTGLITVLMVQQDGPWAKDGDKIPEVLDQTAKTILRDSVSSQPADSGWNGYTTQHFEVEGRSCLLVVPPHPAPGNPWIWRTEFFGAFPQVDLALLAKGYHVAYMDMQNMYGAPVALDLMDGFYKALTEQYHLAAKCVLEGFSRGGLYAFNWAARRPPNVECLYVDAPVCDFKSWPAGKGSGKGSPADWERCKTAYHLSEEQAAQYALNPIDNLTPLAQARLPIIAVCGDADDVVPIKENILVVRDRYQKLGGEIQVIIKPGVAHHPHSLDDPAPVVDFITNHRGQQKASAGSDRSSRP